MLSVAIALGAVAAALALHEHQFVATFNLTFNGAARSFHAPAIPGWRDPVAILLAATGIAVGMHISFDWRTVEVASIVLGCALASAVYVHHQDAYRYPCPPFTLACPFTLPPPVLWRDSTSVLLVVAGLALAIGILNWRRLRTHFPASEQLRP